MRTEQEQYMIDKEAFDCANRLMDSVVMRDGAAARIFREIFDREHGKQAISALLMNAFSQGCDFAAEVALREAQEADE